MVIDNQYLSLTYTPSYTLSNCLKIRLLQSPDTMSDSSDRCVISITLPNNLSYNKIQRKVIDNKNKHNLAYYRQYLVYLPHERYS